MLGRSNPFRDGRLSVAVKGYEAAIKDPELKKRIHTPYDVSIENVSSEEFPHHVKVAFSFKEDKPDPAMRGKIIEGERNRVVMYLNKEKQYVPERFESYSSKFGSLQKPASISRVVKWNQLENGIWYPEESVYQRFTKTTLGKEIVRTIEDKWSYQEEFRVKKLDLNPHYDNAFFEQIEFPEGAAIYKDGIRLPRTN